MTWSISYYILKIISIVFEELPKYARQPMPIGEKINLRFEVACGQPIVYEWLKQGLEKIEILDLFFIFFYFQIDKCFQH